MSLFYEQVGEQGDGGYRRRRSFSRWLASFVWRFRLNQALKITDMRRQPTVYAAMWDAISYRSPQYLKDWKETNRMVGDAVDDLYDLMEWLREGKHYAEADRLRTIISRIASAVPEHQIRRDKNGKMFLLRDIARTYK